MLATARQRPQPRGDRGERLVGFAGERLAKDLPMLGFGGAVVSRRPCLETAHQLVVEVADDQRSGHDVDDSIDLDWSQAGILSLLSRGALFDDPAADELEIPNAWISPISGRGRRSACWRQCP
jgi:hypothetical protein